jgi:hypothetical protein
MNAKWVSYPAHRTLSAHGVWFCHGNKLRIRARCQQPAKAVDATPTGADYTNL